MINDKDFEKDLEYIRDRFEHDGLRTPDSLSSDAMKQRLAGIQAEDAVCQSDTAADVKTVSAASQSVSTSRPEKASRPRRRALIAAAACILLAICLIPALKTVLPNSQNADGGSATMTADSNDLYQFSDYDELDQAMKELIPTESGGDLILYGSGPGDVDMAAEEDAVEGSGKDLQMDAEAPAMTGGTSDGAANGAVTGNSPGGKSTGDVPEHSSTYAQVEGIDEADIVKTDGKYIYYLSGIENQVIIARAKNGKAKRVAAIGGGHEGAYIEDIYIHDDKLVIIGSARGGLTGQNDDGILSVRSGDLWTDATIAAVYDISDRTDPRYLTRYSQTGTLLSSRLIDGRVCLVTNDYIYSYHRGCNVPYVSYDTGDPARLSIGDIGCIPQTATPAYTVVGLMDLSSGKASEKSVRTKAVLGGSGEIYCSGDHLYVAGAVNPDPDLTLTGTNDGLAGALEEDGTLTDTLPAEDALTDSSTGDLALPMAPMPAWTQILKISLADGKVKYENSALVEGDVNDQFSMDESNGTFKVATTSQREKHGNSYEVMDVNNLFIFDEDMKKIGSVIGFAKDEHIEAVRYIKDKAYVITYEQTDPLFIIDLSDPANPVIEGHVKISGFSTLLVPADQDHLLGLGFSTEATEFGEATDGFKLALFDISDPARPKVADSRSCPGYYSEVQYDHKALLVGPAAAWYAIPYDSDWETQYGILMFSAKAGRLRVMDDFTTKESVRRCIYIGDYLYGICVDDSIKGFRFR